MSGLMQSELAERLQNNAAPSARYLVSSADAVFVGS